MTRFALRLLRWTAFGGFALCAVVASGCGDDGGTPAASARETQLPGTQWALDKSALGVGDAGSVHSWITFERDRASGNDGCNTFSGSYEVDGSKLTFGPLAGTNRLCGSPADEVARKVLAGLAKTRGYETTGDTLRMQDSGGRTVLAYRADQAGIEGSWK